MILNVSCQSTASCSCIAHLPSLGVKMLNTDWLLAFLMSNKRLAKEIFFVIKLSKNPLFCCSSYCNLDNYVNDQLTCRELLANHSAFITNSSDPFYNLPATSRQTNRQIYKPTSNTETNASQLA